MFVFGINLVAEGGAFGIKHTGCIVCGNVLAKALHHVDHAANGARGRTGGVARYGPQIGHGMECTVQIAGAIHQQQGFLVAHTPIVPVEKPFCARMPYQKCLQHPLQSDHEFRHAFPHLPHPFKSPLSHGCFYARF